MKQCPFCAEEIQNDAIFCKFCKSSLSQTSKGNEFTNKKHQRIIKYIIIGSLVFLARVFWYLAFPETGSFWYIVICGLGLWYLWKKSTLDKKKKWMITASIVVLFLFFSYTKRTPTVVILEPQNEASVQENKVTITGTIDPKSSKVKINNTDVNLNFKGGKFAYEAELPNEKNLFVVSASHSGKTATASVTVNRVLTEEEKQRIEEEKRKEEEARQVEADNKLKDKLQLEIENFSKPNPVDWTGSEEKILIEALTFSTYGEFIEPAKISKNPELQKLGKQLEGLISQRQVKEFPLLREAEAKWLKNALFVNDIDVGIYGSGSRTITFTSYRYALNQNILDAHNSLVGKLKALRFDRVNYKWSEYAEYTYFDLETPKDSEVITD